MQYMTLIWLVMNNKNKMECEPSPLKEDSIESEPVMSKNCDINDNMDMMTHVKSNMLKLSSLRALANQNDFLLYSRKVLSHPLLLLRVC